MVGSGFRGPLFNQRDLTGNARWIYGGRARKIGEKILANFKIKFLTR